MHSSSARVLTISAFMLGMFLSATSFADDCATILHNQKWNTNFDKMRSELQAKNYETALQSAKILYDICPRSPALNYYIGVALKETNEDTKATIYFQKASEYTSEFTVSTEMSRLIWYARYEGENPERTDLAMATQKQKKHTAQHSARDAQTRQCCKRCRNCRYEGINGIP